MTGNLDSKINVPADLLDKIMSRIDVEQKKIARQRFIFGVAVFLVVLVGLVPTWQLFYSEISQSGFLQYLAFGISDFNLIVSQWQDFSLSLLESLPIVSTMSLFMVVFILLLTLKFITKYSKDVFINSHHFILIHKA